MAKAPNLIPQITLRITLISLTEQQADLVRQGLNRVAADTNDKQAEQSCYDLIDRLDGKA
jgi:hypothetical protein